MARMREMTVPLLLLLLRGGEERMRRTDVVMMMKGDGISVEIEMVMVDGGAVVVVDEVGSGRIGGISEGRTGLFVSDMN